MSAAEEGLDYDGGFDVTEEVELDDLSTQTGNDVIEPARKVLFEIRKASVRDYVARDESAWRKKYLALDLAVGSEGIDGAGKYANKHFFQDLLLMANIKEFPELDTDNYRTKARFDTKVFLKALGYDPAKPPRINDDFLVEISGRQVIADITKRSIDVQQDGKWMKTGDFKNEIKNFKSAETE